MIWLKTIKKKLFDEKHLRNHGLKKFEEIKNIFNYKKKKKKTLIIVLTLYQNIKKKL